MNILQCGYRLSTLLMAFNITTFLCGMENSTVPNLAPDQVVLTISESDNPALEPLKAELALLGDHINQMQEITHKRKPDDDAAGAAPLLMHSRTPFNTPERHKPCARRAHRPAPVDTGVGLGNLDLSNFAAASLSPLVQVPPPSPEEGIQGIERSIKNLEKLSEDLKNQNDLTEQERKALEFININSKKALHANPHVIAAAALGAGAGALAWAAKINPFRIYKECCSNKFTGLEAPAVLAALKALIGPVVAIIGIGILWYKFKQWVVEPYQEAHKKEVEKFKEVLAEHKAQVHKALMVTQQQSEDIHKEITATLASIRRATDEQLQRAERTNREQLEHTLKMVAASEEELKQKIAEFTKQTTGDLGTINENVHDLQQTRNQMQQTTAQLVAQQASILQLVNKIKKSEEELLKLLKNKPLVALPPRSPGSAPLGGRGSGILVVPPPSPQSAQLPGTERQSFLSKLRGKKSNSPLAVPVLTLPAKDESESKRSAARNSLTPPLTHMQ